MRDAPLKLLARDAEDLAVISAMLQDALVPLAEIAWRPGEGRFVLVANRFRWEHAPESDARGAVRERVHTGLCIDNVRRVRRRGFDPRRKVGLLSLLAIRHSVLDDGHAIDLVFAGGPEIRVEATALACRLDDLDQPWPTRYEPRHDQES